MSGHAVGAIGVPFVVDIAAHTRFLLCLPLIIGAEVIVHLRIKEVVRPILDRGIVAPENRPQFESVIAAAMRLRKLIFAEVPALAFAIVGDDWIGKRYVETRVPTWHSARIGNHLPLTLDGHRNFCVSLTIARFLLFRWYFRLFAWCCFL